ncbi:carbohydrate ABC transporter permease [Streptomyces sp. DSM 44915]|uniref:Carbohydrate ABC transporter permease n=1 Tax=Streptomyces chisholmiae TaxID=3075540 RepID=A0ABU2JRD2_9ACTN|nr:carbohydrate ABC transporter permease [Streptomyces sp. DSM 44915]MDT0267522.1 carbohydrate ABC transporter permease [Streptomyces sp. DSM 44915]
MSHPRPLPRQRKSLVLTLMMSLLLVYTLLPILWLLINSTKSQDSLLSSFGLWFSGDFSLWDNISDTFAYADGQFGRWLLNTLLYVVVGAGGGTILATLAGYGLARFDFPGRRLFLPVLLGAIAIPATALAVPTFLMFSNMGLTNTPWAVIIPSLINPLGLYLVWFFTEDAVPGQMLEAARIDGAGEFRIFRSIALRLLMPALVPVLLFSFVTSWNNYFLPLIMLNDADWLPLTVGLNNWSAQNQQAVTATGEAIDNLIITGSLISIIPTIVLFLSLQRFWETGLVSGGVKE